MILDLLVDDISLPCICLPPDLLLANALPPLVACPESRCLKVCPTRPVQLVVLGSGCGWRGIGVQWVTTVAGSGRQTKLQADRGEAIRVDIEHVRAREGEGLGGILEWGDRDTREINDDG